MAEDTRKLLKIKKKSKKRGLPGHVKTSAVQLTEMEVVIKNLLSPHADRIQIYHATEDKADKPQPLKGRRPKKKKKSIR